MILHLSDLHFGTEKPECIQAIQKFCLEHQPEAVVVSGDLTQRARYKQFYDCKQFLDGLNLPYIVIPGNHDIPLYHLWKRLFSPFARYRLFFGKMESVLETAHFYMVGLNTIRVRHHTRGSISNDQIQATQSLLEQAPADKIKLIIAHQPFYLPPNQLHGIKDRPALAQVALQTWGQAGLNGILHGHLHQSAVYDLNHIYDLKAQHPVLEIHAGTATSYRLHQDLPNSFNVMHANGQVQHYCFDDLAKEFVLTNGIHQ